jgi:hypothetical protein
MFKSVAKNLTYEDVLKFKQIGLDTVRIRLLDDPSKLGYSNYDEYLDWVKQVVDWSLKAGLNPVLAL